MVNASLTRDSGDLSEQKRASKINEINAGLAIVRAGVQGLASCRLGCCKVKQVVRSIFVSFVVQFFIDLFHWSGSRF